MPDVASLQVNVTVTLVVLMPAEFGAGEGVAVIVGGVLSRLIVAVALALLPATSTAVPEMT